MLIDLLCQPLKFFCEIYFRKVKTPGLKRIKDRQPVILMLEPPSSWQDLLLLFSVLGKPFWLVISAHLMRTPLMRFVYRMLHIIPIYQLDGSKRECHKNQQTFDKCRDILMQNGTVVMFYEPADASQPFTARLKKAAARMALSAEEVFDFKLKVKMVPVSIQRQSGSHAVAFGWPVKVKSYEAIYKEHPAKAIRLLTDEVATSLEALTEKTSFDPFSDKQIPCFPQSNFASTEK